jgi:hypothetical protein
MMHFGNCVGCVGVGADVVAAAEAGVVGTVQCADPSSLIRLSPSVITPPPIETCRCLTVTLLLYMQAYARFCT